MHTSENAAKADAAVPAAADAVVPGLDGRRLVGPSPDEAAAVADTLIELPKISTLLQPMAAIIPLQLFACELATVKGHDVDQPRNLAKSVTVE